MNIFVFGSNAKGIHGRGAARTAHLEYGAEMGVGEGRTGNAYAIPTKDAPYQRRNLWKIRASIDYFLQYAAAHPELEFKVTRIGCGLAGYTDQEIAPCFAEAPANCQFDPAWKRFGLKTWKTSDESTSGLG